MAGEFGPGTKVNVATLVAVVGAAVWLDRRISIAETSAVNSQEVMAVQNKAQFDSIAVQTKAEFEKVDLRLRSIEGATSSVADDLWKRSDMRAYIREANAGGAKLPPIPE